MRAILACVAFTLLLAGCTFARQKQAKATEALAGNHAALDEQSRALTTGVVDSLSLAPTNPPTALALDLAKRDQIIEGLPTNRIDVPAILAGVKTAQDALDARFRSIDTLLAQKATLEASLREAEAKLIEMGRLYEAERNRGILRRIWLGVVGSLGLGGVIALVMLCPALLPLAGRGVGAIVAKLPSLAGYLGLVSHRAFDSVVKGVGEVRASLDKSSAFRQQLDNELLKATDEDHRRLIDARRAALNV
jgi:hypothetical protein